MSNDERFDAMLEINDLLAELEVTDDVPEDIEEEGIEYVVEDVKMESGEVDE